MLSISKQLKSYAVCLLLISVGFTPSVSAARSDDDSSSALWLGAAIVGGIGGIVLAPVIVPAIGFTAGGIAANSVAAGAMSTLGSGSAVVATLQSVGATGTVLSSGAATLTAIGAGTVAVAGAAKMMTSSD